MDKRENDFVEKKYDLFEHQMLWYINRWATKTHMTVCREKMTTKRTDTLKDKSIEAQLTFLHRPISHQPNSHEYTEDVLRDSNWPSETDERIMI